MIRRVTMRDIAEKVRMSRATVSAVLGNKTHCYASEKTKSLIRETAMQMGYSPNPLACGLKGGRTHTIGLIESSLQNEVRRQEVVNFTNLLDERNYRLYVAYYKGEERLLQIACDDLLSRGCDALVISGKLTEKMYQIIAEITDPVIVLSSSPECLKREGELFSDHSSGTREALEHLIALNHRHIRMIGKEWDEFNSDLRPVTFRQVMKQHGLGAKDMLHVLDKESDLTPDFMKVFLRKNPDCTAIFCTNDFLAMRVIQSCSKLGLRVPEDMSVIGFDDISASVCYNPPLTTVRQPSMEGAKAGIQMLMNRLENENKPVPRHLLSHLVVRETTAPPRVRPLPEMK